MHVESKRYSSTPVMCMPYCAGRYTYACMYGGDASSKQRSAVVSVHCVYFFIRAPSCAIRGDQAGERSTPGLPLPLPDLHALLPVLLQLLTVSELEVATEHHMTMPSGSPFFFAATANSKAFSFR